MKEWRSEGVEEWRSEGVEEWRSGGSYELRIGLTHNYLEILILRGANERITVTFDIFCVSPEEFRIMN